MKPPGLYLKLLEFRPEKLLLTAKLGFEKILGFFGWNGFLTWFRFYSFICSYLICCFKALFSFSIESRMI